MELLTLKSILLFFGEVGNLYNLDEIEREMIFYKTMKKNFSNLFSTWEKCVSLNCGNFCRTTRIHLVHKLTECTHLPSNCVRDWYTQWVRSKSPESLTKFERISREFSEKFIKCDVIEIPIFCKCLLHISFFIKTDGRQGIWPPPSGLAYSPAVDQLLCFDIAYCKVYDLLSHPRNKRWSFSFVLD